MILGESDLLTVKYKRINFSHLKILLIILCLLTFSINAFSGAIEEELLFWKPFYKEVTPEKVAYNWYLPFQTPNRNDFYTLKINDTFGKKNETYVQNHLSTGIELTPINAEGHTNYVYPLSDGAICAVYFGHPNKTIAIKHILPDNKIIFTTYKHLAEVYVTNGQQVTPKTKLGRLYSGEEIEKWGENNSLLFLEIRKDFNDYGVASWATLTKQSLVDRFENPLNFLRQYLKKISP